MQAHPIIRISITYSVLSPFFGVMKSQVQMTVVMTEVVWIWQFHLMSFRLHGNPHQVSFDIGGCTAETNSCRKCKAILEQARSSTQGWLVNKLFTHIVIFPKLLFNSNCTLMEQTWYVPAACAMTPSGSMWLCTVFSQTDTAATVYFLALLLRLLLESSH